MKKRIWDLLLIYFLIGLPIEGALLGVFWVAPTKSEVVALILAVVIAVQAVGILETLRVYSWKEVNQK